MSCTPTSAFGRAMPTPPAVQVPPSLAAAPVTRHGHWSPWCCGDGHPLRDGTRVPSGTVGRRRRLPRRLARLRPHGPPWSLAVPARIGRITRRHLPSRRPCLAHLVGLPALCDEGQGGRATLPADDLGPLAFQVFVRV